MCMSWRRFRQTDIFFRYKSNVWSGPMGPGCHEYLRELMGRCHIIVLYVYFVTRFVPRPIFKLFILPRPQNPVCESGMSAKK